MYLIKPPTKFKEFNFAGRPYAGTTAGANLRTSNGLQTERIDSSQFKAHRMPDFSSVSAVFIFQYSLSFLKKRKHSFFHIHFESDLILFLFIFVVRFTKDKEKWMQNK